MGDDICQKILSVLDKNLIPKASTGESKVFYQKMKADYYRYIAEYSDDQKKKDAAGNAEKAYGDAQAVAEKDLATKVEAELDDICQKILSVLDKNLISSVEQKETSKGNTENAGNAKEYRTRQSPRRIWLSRTQSVLVSL